MSHIHSWWRDNGGIVLVFLAQLIIGFILNYRLENTSIDRRLAIFEERQQTVIRTLKENGGRIDSLSEELKKHELDKK